MFNVGTRQLLTSTWRSAIVIREIQRNIMTMTKNSVTGQEKIDMTASSSKNYQSIEITIDTTSSPFGKAPSMSYLFSQLYQDDEGEFSKISWWDRDHLSTSREDFINMYISWHSDLPNKYIDFSSPIISTGGWNCFSGIWLIQINWYWEKKDSSFPQREAVWINRKNDRNEVVFSNNLFSSIYSASSSHLSIRNSFIVLLFLINTSNTIVENDMIVELASNLSFNLPSEVGIGEWKWSKKNALIPRKDGEDSGWNRDQHSSRVTFCKGYHLEPAKHPYLLLLQQSHERI